MKWLCGLQRVKRELLPLASIISAVKGVQLWLPEPDPPEAAEEVLAAALLAGVEAAELAGEGAG